MYIWYIHSLLLFFDNIPWLAEVIRKANFWKETLKKPTPKTSQIEEKPTPVRCFCWFNFPPSSSGLFLVPLQQNIQVLLLLLLLMLILAILLMLLFRFALNQNNHWSLFFFPSVLSCLSIFLSLFSVFFSSSLARLPGVILVNCVKISLQDKYCFVEEFPHTHHYIVYTHTHTSFS